MRLIQYTFRMKNKKKLLLPLAVVVVLVILANRLNVWDGASEEYICTVRAEARECDATKVNTIGWEDSPFISPDGQKLYFMYNSWNLMPVFTGGKAYKTGLLRPGQTEGDSPWQEEAGWYVSTKRDDGTWSSPERLFDGCCAMTNDEKTWYYQRPGEGMDYANIHLLAQNGNGSWGAPQNLGDAVNTEHIEDNPHLSRTGLLMWSSTRTDGFGGKDIWFSQRTTDGSWSTAQNLGPNINTKEDEDQPWISPDGTILYFNRGITLMKSTFSAGGGWGSPEKLVFSGGEVFGAEPSLPDDMRTLYFAQVKPGEWNDLKIVFSTLQPDGTWSAPVPVD